MIRINLLPFRAARKSENIRRQISLFVLSLILLILVMGYFQIILNNKISRLTGTLAATNKELKVYQAKAKEVAKIEKKLKAIDNRNGAVLALDKNRKDALVLLDSMTQLIVPNRMWLTKLVNRGKRVELSGIALDNKTTADFMKQLENSQLYGGVKLRAVKRQVANKQEMKSFSINCVRVKPKKPGADKTKNKK